MMTTDSLNNEILNDLKDDLECNNNNNNNELEVSEISSSDSESELSLSEKIVLESNEKRLRNRMTNLQTSIMNLKEQLKLEKELWKEDMEKIRSLQKQQEMRCTCPVHQQPKPAEISKIEIPVKCNSIYSLVGLASDHQISKHNDDLMKTQSIKQLLELQNYKRKLAETENMCSVELLKVKQSIQDLKTLQNIALEWGKDDGEKGDNLTRTEITFSEDYFLTNTEKMQ